jgi:endoglucanase
VQPGVTATIQAENCFISNGDLESIHSGYTGSGYVNFVNQSGGYIEWTISINSSSQAECRVFFANGGTGGRPCEIRVNNNVAVGNLDFPQTSGWANWSSVTASINLNSGTNVIRLTGTGSEGGPNVDRIEITPGGSSTPVPTNPPTSAPTTPPSQDLLGDVNGDGVVTITDALLIARYYVNLNPSPFNSNVADTNCDSNVNILDALLIARYYVGLISSFC